MPQIIIPIYIDPGSGTWTPGGVSDHGALTGLGDDDHPQYQTQARSDARYSQLSHLHTGVYSPVAHNHTGTYAPFSHDHQMDSVIGLSDEFVLNRFARYFMS